MRGWNMFYFVLGACASSGGAGADGGARAIHVAVRGNDAADGSARSPVRHVDVAIGRCEAPCEVRIAAGEYVEMVTLESGVDLVGGWSDDFATRDPAAYPVTLTADWPRAVIVESLDAPTAIDGVTIRGADVAEGASVALWVRDSGEHLILRGVRVEGGAGAPGVDGADGSLVACSAPGGAGGTAFDCGGAAGGPGEAGGDPASGGAGGGGGGSNCPAACPLVGSDGVGDGAPGTNGGAGGDGAPGVAATDPDGAFLDDAWFPATATGGARGAHGTGGGGGGSGGSKRFVACFGCGTLLGGRGGDGAPGGCAGDGGGAGTPGGASFGIVIVRSTVRVASVAIAGGAGGRGGDGGDGHAGEPGGTSTDVGREPARWQQCGAIQYASGGGGPGGLGGPGGHGGGGAGGGGGPSIGVALVGGAEIATGEPGDLAVTLGTAGEGGAGGTGAAPAPDGLRGLLAPVVTF